MAFSGPHDVLIEHIVAIADALDGKTEAQSDKTGNRLRDALSRIADYFDENPIGGGSGSAASALPEVSVADNGSVLKVVEGVWAKGTDAVGEAELPAVTASNNGAVLKVADGAWAIGAETTELPAVTASNNGQVLKVVNGAWTVDHEIVELPQVNEDDNGKILKVVNGAWAVADAG